jgi:hypothetical protein
MQDDVSEVLKDLEEPVQPSPGNAVMRPLVLALIQSSYVHTQTLSEFARDVVAIVNTAVSVPVAFAEGFLRSFLAIQSVREDDSGHIIIVPKPGASEEDIFREVDQLTAQIEPGAVYNPLVREQMDRLAEATNELMRADLAAMGELSSEELHSALKDLQERELPETSGRGVELELHEVRHRIEKVRDAIRAYQISPRASLPPLDDGPGLSAPIAPPAPEGSPGAASV